MASYNKRTKRKYGPTNAVDGNLARKLDRLDRSGQMDFDELYEPQRESAIERNARRRAQAKAAVRVVQKPSNVIMLGFACAAALLVVLLLCHVKMNTISRSIVDMKTDIKQLEIEQVSLITQYEQTFDLSVVKQAALAAGMVQPGESQVYYISLPGEDQATAHHPSDQTWDRVLRALGQ